MNAKHLFVAATLLCSAVPAMATTQTVVSCPAGGGGDLTSRGFYVANYPASSLSSVQLVYFASQAGSYTITLRASLGTFDGALIGARSRTVTLPANAPAGTAETFDFEGTPVAPGSTVVFSQSVLGPGEDTLLYDSGTGALGTGHGTGTCGVTETEDDAPPLSVDRRNTVAVTITAAPAGACVTSATDLCIDDQIGDNRFQATSSFSTTQGGGLSGNGKAIALAPIGVTEGGLFWFFNFTNPEMLVKVINACALNGHYWVFFAAVTNVGFTVTVQDTVTGHSKVYTNPDLKAAAPVQDVNALSCN